MAEREIIGELWAMVGADTDPLKRAEAEALRSTERIDRGLQGLTASARKVNMRVDVSPILDLQRQTEESIRRIESQMSGLGSGITAAIAGISFKELGESVVTASIDMDRIEQSMKAVMGTSSAAASEISFLRAESERLGINFRDSAQGYARMAAAARSAGLENRQLRDIFSAVAETAVTLKMSQDQVSGTFLALEQMLNKSTVQAEELRRQLANYIPGAFTTSAKAMSYTTMELGKLMEQGAIPAAEFLPRLAVELRKTFGAGLSDAINSTNSNIQRFKNSLFEAANAFADAGAMDQFNAGLKFATTNMQQLTNAATIAAGAMAAIYVSRKVGAGVGAAADFTNNIRNQIQAQRAQVAAELEAAKAAEVAAQAERERTAEMIKTIKAEEAAAASARKLAIERAAPGVAARAEIAVRREAIAVQLEETQSAYVAAQASVEAAAARRASAEAAAKLTMQLAPVVGATNSATAAKKMLRAALVEVGAATQQHTRALAQLMELEVAEEALSRRLAATESALSSTHTNSSRQRRLAMLELQAATDTLKIKTRERVVATEAAAAADVAASAAAQARVVAEGRVVAAMSGTRTAMGLLQSAGSGLLAMLGGWPGVLFTAGTALYLFRDKIFGTRDAVKELDDQVRGYLQTKRELARSESDKSGELMKRQQEQIEAEVQNMKRLEAERDAMKERIARGGADPNMMIGQVARPQAPQLDLYNQKIAESENRIKTMRLALRSLSDAHEENVRSEKQNTDAGKENTDQINEQIASVGKLIERQKAKNAQLKATLGGDKEGATLAQAEQQWVEATAAAYSRLALEKKSAAGITDPAEKQKKLAQINAETSALKKQHDEFIALNRTEAQLTLDIESQKKAAHDRETARRDREREAEAELKRNLKEIEKIHEQSRTPLERYNEKLADLERLSKIIDPETKQLALSTTDLARAQAAAKREFDATQSAYQDFIDSIVAETEALKLEKEARGGALEFLKKDYELRRTLKKNGIEYTDEMRENLRRVTAENAAANEEIAHQRRLMDEVKTATESLRTEEEKRIETTLLLNEAVAKGMITQDKANEAIRRMQPQYQRLQQMGEGFIDIMGRGFEQIALEGATLSDTLKQITKDIARMIYEVMVLEPLKAGLKNSMAGGGGGGFFGMFAKAGASAAADGGASSALVGSAAIPGFAKGGMFDGGTATPWDGRDVVNTKTMFGRGMMGEAGPEAIVPLKRTPNGELGISATPSEPPQVIINVHRPEGTDVKTEERVGPDGVKSLEMFIIKTVTRAGNEGALNGMMKNQYNLVPRGRAI